MGSIAGVATVVEVTRQEWEEGNRRFEAAVQEPGLRQRLLGQLEIVTDELRRRVGQTFTLEQLAGIYADADRWVHETAGERAAFPGWTRHLSEVQAAAFYLYQRGAVDYAP
ncbi:MAG TPA: hypothetical protein VGF21_19180 [Thermoleophilaceae bacterium]